MSADIITQLQETMQELSDQKQEQVLRYARTLRRPEGVSGKDFLQFASLFPPEDLAEIKASIEDDCDQVDVNHNDPMMPVS